MKKTIKLLIVLIIIVTIIVTSINLYVISITKSNIKKLEALNYDEIDCILVLGAGIKNEEPSPMLEDRLLTSIDLYKKRISDKIIVSGDHGQQTYDEVNVMKKYLIEKKIPSENIFMDHAGFSTYESIYRAKEVFGVKKMVIITQKYHLYRALYIAEKLGIEAYGVAYDYHIYAGQSMRDLREVLARAKDFVATIVKPEPTYLGDFIDIHGDGNVTND